MKREKKENSKHSKKRKIKVKIIAFILFLGTFLFSSISLLRWYIYNQKSSNITQKIIEQTENRKENSKNPIDFEKLKNENSDVVGWIKIEGTKINYPIVQAENNEYYLTRDIYKNYNICGWIFMDYMNSKKFIDMNTVIYGHNLKSGLMFADLNKVVNGELGKDIKLEIYTEDKRLEYKVFSSYIEKPNANSVDSSIVDETVKQKYIKNMLEKSQTLYNIVPDKSDRLITLSTCDNTGDKRIIVHCVNTKEEIF